MHYPISLFFYLGDFLFLGPIIQDEETDTARSPGANSGSKTVWKSQHINPQGKLTDFVHVELEASSRQQGHDWVDLLTYLAQIPNNKGVDGTSAAAASAATEKEKETAEVTGDGSGEKSGQPVAAAAATGAAAAIALEQLDNAFEEVLPTSASMFICSTQHNHIPPWQIEKDKARTEEMASISSELMRSSGIVPDILPEAVTLTHGLSIKVFCSE